MIEIPLEIIGWIIVLFVSGLCIYSIIRSFRHKYNLAEENNDPNSKLKDRWGGISLLIIMWGLTAVTVKWITFT